MNKREFLKKSVVLGGAGLVLPSLATSCMTNTAGPRAGASLAVCDSEGVFTQPALGYGFAALEPHIDALTMELHYARHHAGYTRKFNAAIKEEGLHLNDIEKIFAGVSGFGAAVRNNGGGYYNHNLYWKTMSPDGGGKPEGELLAALEKDFGSFEEFRALMSTTAASLFGSGWAWLILNREGTLQVVSTPNQDNPLMDLAQVQGRPLMNIDVWEHAYYLNYQNARKAYIDAFWNLVDWDFVSALYDEALASSRQ